MDINLDNIDNMVITNNASRTIDCQTSNEGGSDHSLNHLKIIQVNLNHSKQASDLLKNL